MKQHLCCTTLRRVMKRLNLLVAILGILCLHTQAQEPAPTSPCPDQKSLNAVEWVQTSGEFTALTLSIYRNATDHLKRILANPDKTISAAIEQPSCDPTLPLAVIMDLDETVLDNSAFEAQVLIDQVRRVHLQRQEFLELEAGGLVPGSIEFIREVLAAQVKIFAITNRRLPEKEHTLNRLRKLGIQVDNPAQFEVMFRNDSVGWTRDKTSRRREVAQTHRIILIIGDQLGDFVSTDGVDSKVQREMGQVYSEFWGTRWHILPNPIYGGWQHKTTEFLKGYKH